MQYAVSTCGRAEQVCQSSELKAQNSKLSFYSILYRMGRISHMRACIPCNHCKVFWWADEEISSHTINFFYEKYLNKLQ